MDGQWLQLVYWVLCAALAVFLVWLTRLAARRDERLLSEWRATELRVFRLQDIASEDPRLAMSGRDALTLIQSEEQHRTRAGLQWLQIQRYLRNRAGEYFYWRWRSDNDGYFIRHISHASAKLVLKDKYVAPSGMANV